MNPIFTIITPSYNKFLYVEDMIQSVLAQTEASWELIIIDDASTDQTTDILRKYEGTDKRLKIVYKNTNTGANACRNQGIDMANGTYTIFVDADDLMADFCLAQRLEAINKQPSADIWTFNMAIFDQEIGDMPTSKNWIVPTDTNQYLAAFLRHDIPWQTMQSTWSTKYLQKLGGFDPEFKEFDDVEVHTSAILQGAKIMPFHKLPIDVYYRIDENRKQITKLEFHKLIVKTSVQYYRKFYPKLHSKPLKKQLTGTLFQPLTALCWQYRNKGISESEFEQLKGELITNCQINRHQKLLNSYQKIATALPFHLPGLKKIFGILIGK